MPYMNKQHDTQIDEHLLTLQQAALMLGVHPITLKRWERAGKIKFVRLPIGNRPRITATEVKRLMESERGEA